ncbi:MAG TPA: hypothetical protein VGG33_12140 [Polyangia bacterium]
MIPESELARALARWKARKNGTAPPPDREVTIEVGDESQPHAFGVQTDEPTRVAQAQYESEVETPPAEVQLSDGDFEDHTRGQK